MKVLGVIPARGGSKGIPKKNIKLLLGKPLIEYTITEALKSKLDKVVVSTDSKEIASFCKKFNIDVIMRSENLAQDDTPTLPVIQDAYQKVRFEFDAIMTLQPTSPLRTFGHINESIDLFSNDSKADSLVSVVDVPHNFTPDKIMTIQDKYLKGDLMVKRRQEVDTYFARNGAAIYLTRIKHISEFIFGGNILPFHMNKIDSFDIDDIDDWMIVESIMMYRIENLNV